MRTPFVKNQASSAVSKTEKKVGQNVADDKAVGEDPLPENKKSQNKMVKNKTLLEEKALSTALRTRKSLFRK